MDEVGGS